jgi:hypothetical protein
MSMPGSTQLSLAKKFLLSLPWNEMQPATNIFEGVVSAAISKDKRHALAYSTGTKTFTADFAQFSGDMNAKWFDPTNGELKAASIGAGRDFTPPGKNSAGDLDWLLILEPK